MSHMVSCVSGCFVWASAVIAAATNTASSREGTQRRIGTGDVVIGKAPVGHRDTSRGARRFYRVASCFSAAGGVSFQCRIALNNMPNSPWFCHR